MTMDRRSHPDAPLYYLGDRPHREKWTIYGEGDSDRVWSHIEESGIAHHGNALYLSQHIELPCGRMEVQLCSIDPYCDGTSYEL